MGHEEAGGLRMRGHTVEHEPEKLASGAIRYVEEALMDRAAVATRPNSGTLLKGY